MKIVLLGKNGQLGQELQNTLTAMGDVISLGRADLDLATPKSIETTLTALKPHIIINASAYTEVDRAESQIELANNINALAPGIMAKTARQIGAVFIHYSTDYVFDGKSSIPYVESDTTNPLNAYGQSKLDGENNIQQTGDAYLIFRTSWVYSMNGNSFVNKVLQWSRVNTTLRVVDDQISSPTWARMLAEISTTLLSQNKGDLLDAIRERRGIYHVAGSGYTSRYEWAKEILANDSNQTEQLVQTTEPVSSQEFPTPAQRPLFSALNCTKFKTTFNLPIPGWKESLQIAMTEPNIFGK